MGNPMVFDRLDAAVRSALEHRRGRPAVREVGQVLEVGEGHGIVGGLPGVRADEIVRLANDGLGMVFDLDPERIGVVALDPMTGVRAGDRVTRTGRVMDVPVGTALIGRVIDAAGRALDGGGPIRARERSPVEREAPAILERAPVSVPLQSGIVVVDALIPIGRGQRELILGDRQTGKTAIAVDTILNQAGEDVICIYCAIGQRSSAVANVVAELRDAQAMEYTIVVVATGEDPPGMQFLAPYSAMAMGEHFMRSGKDVLLVLDDLTRHARAYRELSLLLRRPPGREAYPGDIFYVHARLLERATHLADDLGGGSLTALPIIETQAQNISAYVPTNLISITDGQIHVSSRLFRQGLLPAVDVGRSVSRVGGDAQLPAYKGVTGNLRLAYSQFEELEQFTRFGARLEEDTRRTLEHGRRIRELFKQEQSSGVSVTEQISVLLAAVEGLFDEVPLDLIAEAARAVRDSARKRLDGVARVIRAGMGLGDAERGRILDLARGAVSRVTGGASRGKPKPGQRLEARKEGDDHGDD